MERSCRQIGIKEDEQLSFPRKRESRSRPPYQVRGKLCDTCPCENREQGTIQRKWIPHQVRNDIT